MVAYCLFCETIKCEAVLAQAKSAFMDQGWIAGYSPRQVYHVWHDGKILEREQLIFPGYVFLFFEEPFQDYYPLRMLSGVIRILKDGNQVYELSGPDLAFARSILFQKGWIGKVPVYREQERLQIHQGLFDGLEVEILKVNRRTHAMQIQIPLGTEQLKAWVQYEERDPKGVDDEMTANSLV